MTALSDRHPMHDSRLLQEMQLTAVDDVVCLSWRVVCGCGFEGPSRERSDLARRDEEWHQLTAWIDSAESA